MAKRTDELDLYASPGWRESIGFKALGWKGVTTLGVSLTIVIGAAAYGWMTNSAPITVDQALQEFRQSASRQPASSAGSSQKITGAKQREEKNTNKGPKRPRGTAPKQGARTKLAAAAPSDQAEAPNQDPGASRPGRNEQTSSEYERTEPQEGVYTWATQGWESAGGARRNFPEESQRVVTIENGGWYQHHYFSNQRETWTRFRVVEDGAAISMQRNKVTFGPVTQDNTIDFAPPMLVGPRDLEVGRKWSGRWSGKTTGSYTGEIFERVTIDIGGEAVEAYGIAIDMQMRGEIEGEVNARVWLSPRYVMTVREHYKQRVKADVGDYNAEWTMTLESLQPQS